MITGYTGATGDAGRTGVKGVPGVVRTGLFEIVFYYSDSQLLYSGWFLMATLYVLLT